MCNATVGLSSKGGDDTKTMGSSHTSTSTSTSTSTKTSVVSPFVSSGFARRKVPIVTLLMGLVVLYHGLVWWFRDSTAGWLRPADEYCHGSRHYGPDCRRPDLFVKQVTSAIMQLYMGGMGLGAWHVTHSVRRRLPPTPEGRLFGYLEEADRLLVGIFVYQVFDFVLSTRIPEHNQPVFLAHHALAAFTAWMSLEYQMVHYYAIFFGGCSEISTIFLVLCDLDVYFPADSSASTWSTLILGCQIGFTLCFLWYRVIGWWRVSYGLWSDVWTVTKTKGTAHDYRPGKVWFLYAFLLMDCLLGTLQLYWFFFGIVPKILEVVG